MCLQGYEEAFIYTGTILEKSKNERQIYFGNTMGRYF